MMASLLTDLGLSDTGLVGVSEAELREVAEDQAVASMPGRYVEFLRVMGRSGGSLLVGTDAFYPDILGIKQDGLQLLADSGVPDLAPSGAVVFAMHQGYQVYWMPGDSSDDPPVYMYQEGDAQVSQEWKSFTEFLRHELTASA
ncbi:SMI1/KNR4 family protein [Nucisporomicrobium flavum]|uniref:SMI1/KNR4 family protein n=1 Tax=Nucisporomicrobium flavum TaxID=2785915 RepID=UPI003C2D6031